MKLGIGPCPQFVKMADFVMSKFSHKDKAKIILMKRIAFNIFNEINMIGFCKAISKNYYQR
ncbi:MAG: hypothetical protein LBQ07_02195 [Endomicrobium sp.]|jgi:peptidyl-tRNA hydrolase|nr:hypothetical protein [Endomicrobium sp.]